MNLHCVWPGGTPLYNLAAIYYRITVGFVYRVAWPIRYELVPLFGYVIS